MLLGAVNVEPTVRRIIPLKIIRFLRKSGFWMKGGVELTLYWSVGGVVPIYWGVGDLEPSMWEYWRC